MNFHNIQRIHARSPGSIGAPLVMRLMSSHGTAEITIFTNDQTYSDMLVDAIDEVWLKLSDPPPRAACPQEVAAYEAEGVAYAFQVEWPVMHDLALTFLVSTVTIGLVLLIYIAALSSLEGPLE